MKIENIEIKNFRLLKDVSLTLEDMSTVIVGRNNSGKTSLTEIFRRFSKREKFKLEDFSLSSIQQFKEALKAKIENKNDDEILSLVPKIEMLMIIDYQDNSDDYGILSDFIIDLDELNFKAKIKIAFKLQKSKIEVFFESLEPKKKDFFDTIRERIQKYYEFEVLAIDTNDDENIAVLEYEKYKSLIRTDFINAQRWLDDETAKENDVLGKVLYSIFKNASKDTAPDEMQVLTKELEVQVKNFQDSVDEDFKNNVDRLIPALDIMGYPGLHDPKFTTKTTFDAKAIIEKNTKLFYQKSSELSLPETYNGLGSRNLIFILFYLYDFFRQFQSDQVRAKNHIIFIEEPEAHLHPQMQEVFIKQLNKIVEIFSETLNNNEKWPVQFIVTTHSTHIANAADFETIRYFLINDQDDLQTKIKDLSEAFKTTDLKNDKDFIHKYLTLTKCDLFFADKAILIEGSTERILMPEFINKLSDSKLNTQYLSIVEIGGAYAHHFFKFLDFLELKTIIITDIDSTKAKQTNKGKRYEACLVVTGESFSNASIKNWFKTKDVDISLAGIRAKTSQDKIIGKRRIAYQIDETGKNCCGRSFEDAFIITNPQLFNITEKDGEALALQAFNEAKDYSDKKTDFAIKYAFEETAWQTPLYIKEGLEWLSNNDN
ncbi:MAG: ATP-dependent endonuclease [Candidatus Kapabacteria bacterium]|nr:ATP-dependent endonuclease [Candidatus Kapabacteria bacterium]